MCENTNTSQGSVDWFARVTAILSLLVALAAVLVPYCQGEADKGEHLTVVAKPEGTGGVIRLSDDESKSRAVQMPWIVMLSNSGRTKLSVVSYRIEQLIQGTGIRLFPGLDGGTSDRENKPVSFPLTLDAGESVSFRLYVGFIPNDEIAKTLKSMFAAGGPLDSHKTLLAFAEKGLTIYGGKASMQKFEGGGYVITIDPSSQRQAPVYNLIFRTGRNQEFSIVISD